MSMPKLTVVAISFGLVVLSVGQLPAATTAPGALPPVSGEVRMKAEKALEAGAKFLLSKRDANGAWPSQFGPAISAMAAKALVQAGYAPDSPEVKKAVEFVLSKQNTEPGRMQGAFSEKMLANYNTSICISTLVMLNSKLPDKPYDKQIRMALDFLRRDQWGGENNPADRQNTNFGGFGYGKGERPDLSNSAMTADALEALKQAGYIKQDDEMFAKLQVFLQRSQNRQESNDVTTVAVGNDGGFFYTPARPAPESKAGQQTSPGGRSTLRSYGSMTYAGFQSYLYSGLSKDDPRVTAAFDWIRKNYTLAENPNMGARGLYYYYHVFAKALRAAGQEKIKEAASGVTHDWRAELVDKLVSLQKPDGHWVNDKANRWEEGDPVLTTCYGMLAIEEAIGN